MDAAALPIRSATPRPSSAGPRAADAATPRAPAQSRAVASCATPRRPRRQPAARPTQPHTPHTPRPRRSGAQPRTPAQGRTPRAPLGDRCVNEEQGRWHGGGTPPQPKCARERRGEAPRCSAAHPPACGAQPHPLAPPHRASVPHAAYTRVPPPPPPSPEQQQQPAERPPPPQQPDEQLQSPRPQQAAQPPSPSTNQGDEQPLVQAAVQPQPQPQALCEEAGVEGNAAGGEAEPPRKHWSLADFELGPVRGEGKYGRVHVVRLKEKKHGMRLVYAMKVLKLHDLSPALLDSELAIHRGLRHPHVVRFVTYFADAAYAFVVMEWCTGGSVWEEIHKARRRGFGERTSARYTAQLAEAVAYLHSRDPPVLHRDIKPENTFLDHNGDLKLGDFGWSAVMKPDADGRTGRRTVCGTPEYFAPEMCREESYGAALDCWCLGIFVYELLCGRPPFEHRDPREVLRRIDRDPVLLPAYPAVSAPARALLRGLLQKDHARRMRAADVVAHPWVVENYYAPTGRTPTLS